MKRRVSNSVQRWRVTRIVGAAAREVCELEANSAEAAIKRAIRESPVTGGDAKTKRAAD